MTNDEEKKWEGFQEAINMILNYIENSGFFESDEIKKCFKEEVLEEVLSYKQEKKCFFCENNKQDLLSE